MTGGRGEINYRRDQTASLLFACSLFYKRYWLKSWQRKRKVLSNAAIIIALLPLDSISGKLIWIVSAEQRRQCGREVCVVNPNQFGWCKTLAGPSHPSSVDNGEMYCVSVKQLQCNGPCDPAVSGQLIPCNCAATLLPNHLPYRASRVSVVWTERKAKNVLTFVITWLFLQLFVEEAHQPGMVWSGDAGEGSVQADPMATPRG